MPLFPALRRHRQIELWKCKANMIYTSSSKLARATVNLKNKRMRRWLLLYANKVLNNVPATWKPQTLTFSQCVGSGEMVQLAIQTWGSEFRFPVLNPSAGEMETGKLLGLAKQLVYLNQKALSQMRDTVSKVIRKACRGQDNTQRERHNNLYTQILKIHTQKLEFIISGNLTNFILWDPISFNLDIIFSEITNWNQNRILEYSVVNTQKLEYYSVVKFKTEK